MRLMVTVLILLSGIALLIFAFPLFQALIIAALLAYLLDPIVRFVMRKLRLRRSLSATLVYALLLILVASIPAIMGTLAVGQVVRWSSELQQAVREINKWISQPVLIFGFDLSPRNILGLLGQSAGSTLTNLTGNTLGIVTTITTNFLWVLLALVSLYYFLKEGPNIKPWLVRLVSPAYQADAHRLLTELDRVWGLFMRVQLLIFIILFILFILGSVVVIWLYKLNLIPFSTVGLVLMLILVYALVQQVDNLWLRPQMLGSQLRLHPGLVFVSLIAALALGGVLAAIVIVPMIASAKVIGRYIRLKLLGLPPWPDETIPQAQMENIS
jgi:predicted PurR-regulated permease PerM